MPKSITVGLKDLPIEDRKIYWESCLLRDEKGIEDITEHQKSIVTHYFGLKGESPKTLSQLVQIMGVKNHSSIYTAIECAFTRFFNARRRRIILSLLGEETEHVRDIEIPVESRREYLNCLFSPNIAKRIINERAFFTGKKGLCDKERELYLAYIKGESFETLFPGVEGKARLGAFRRLRAAEEILYSNIRHGMLLSIHWQGTQRQDKKAS